MSRSFYTRLHRRFGPRPTSKELGEKTHHHADKLTRVFRIDCLAPTSQTQSAHTGKSVVVVGAGLGGLSAAHMLSRWFDVEVLEASGRVGGRAYSRKGFTPGNTIEFGGELIGWNHPLWLHFAKEFDLGLSMITDDASFEAMKLDTPTFLGGQKLSTKEANQVYDEITDALKVMNSDAKQIADPYAPWLTPRAAEWDARALSRFIDDAKVSDLAKDGLRTQFANNNGVEPSGQSYLANLANVAGSAFWDRGNINSFWNDLEVARCSRGNQQLAEALRVKVESVRNCHVSTHTPVLSIEIHDSGVTVNAKGRSPIHADYLVLAVSPTVWHRIRVTPAITIAPQMGKIIKYLSNLDRRFWYTERLSPMAFDDQFGMTWEGTDNQIGSKGIELTTFAGGNAAEAAINARDKRAYFDEQLGRVYPSYPSARIKTEFMNWEEYKWTQAGYSCPAPNQVTTVQRALNEPHHGRLFFAGEHVNPAFFGFMEGALQSGLTAALRILEKDGVDLPPL